MIVLLQQLLQFQCNKAMTSASKPIYRSIYSTSVLSFFFKLYRTLICTRV